VSFLVSFTVFLSGLKKTGRFFYNIPALATTRYLGTIDVLDEKPTLNLRVFLLVCRLAPT